MMAWFLLESNRKFARSFVGRLLRRKSPLQDLAWCALSWRAVSGTDLDIYPATIRYRWVGFSRLTVRSFR